MNILDYTTAESIDSIYQEILKLKPNINILWLKITEQELKDRGLDATGVSLVDRSYNAKIELIESGLTDETISHELLHVLYRLQGFVDIVSIDKYGINSLESLSSTSISNYIQHPFIYKEQLRLGILSEEELKEKLILTVKKIPEEKPTIFSKMWGYILRYFGATLAYRAIWGVDLEMINENHAKIYSEAMSLADAVSKYDINTPFYQRRALVAAFKEYKSIAAKYGEGYLVDLTNKVGVIPIISVHQLSVTANNVLGVFEVTSIDDNLFCWGLKMISDDQSIIFMGTPIESYDVIYEELKQCTVEEFLSKLDIPYLVR